MPLKDLYLSINCIEVDCKDIERCKCSSTDDGCENTPMAHFEIPQVLNDYGSKAIDYIGATDRQLPFTIYTSISNVRNHKYRKRAKRKPYVWIDTTPNENGMYDCFVWGAPLLSMVSVTAVFKDPRQLEQYSCCTDMQDDNASFINDEIKRRLVEQKIRYYRQFAPALLPNDQTYTAG